MIINYLVALALGLLIGLEREYARYQKRGHDYAGIRTFPLISLAGALSAYLGELISVYVLISGILVVGGLVIAAYFITNKSKKYTGATSEVAGLLMFFIGVLSYHGELILATVLAIIITIILFARSLLHHFAKKISTKELADTLKFAVIAFLILPFLPNQGYGPLELFNPFIIWLMVVFISGISFVGYVLYKWFGDRGIPALGMLGGLVSSTATTTSFADQSKKGKKLGKAFAVGVLLANGIMFIRILIEVFVLNRVLFSQLLLPLLLLAILTAVFSYFLWKKAKHTKIKLELSSPFTIVPALKFGIFFGIVLALVKLADIYLATKGIYLVSILSGLADVDAITLSLSNLSSTGSIGLEVARKGIMFAALTNVAVKGGIAYWFGGKQFGRIVVALFAVLIVIGLGVAFLF